MSATDELRALLDERGVEWSDNSDETARYTGWNNNHCWFIEFPDGWTSWGMSNDGTPAQAIEATLGPRITGDTSDGYHTFNELYHHRAVLFSVIVRMMPDKAWKSKLHHTGDMFDGMFIVGIDTPTGQATYHYDIDPYWEMFDCKELERAPEWDGHTPDEAIERIATLGRGECHTVSMDCFGNPPYNQSGLNGNSTACGCSECGAPWSTCGLFRGNALRHNFKACPICGAKVVEK